MFGLDLGRRHTKSERKYGVYCRQVTAYHLGLGEGVYGRLSLFFWGWACGSVGLAVGKRSWRKRGGEQRQMLHWKLPPSQPVTLRT